MTTQITTDIDAKEYAANVRTAYTEVCRSYHALDEARMKRLGLLPIASIVGLVAVGRSAAVTTPTPTELEVIGYVGVFSALFTLALFGYELRGILMCHDLYESGRYLERTMKLAGQFTICDESRQLPCYGGSVRRPLARRINGRVTPCAVYSLIFASWLFVALRYAFGVHLHKCVFWAAGAGIIFTLLTSWLLRYLTVSGRDNDGKTAPGIVEPAMF